MIKKTFTVLLCLLVVLCSLVPVLADEKDPFTVSVAPKEGESLILLESNRYNPVFTVTLTSVGEGFGSAFTVTGLKFALAKTLTVTPLLNQVRPDEITWTWSSDEYGDIFTAPDAGQTVDMTVLWTDDKEEAHETHYSFATLAPTPKVSVELTASDTSFFPGNAVTLTYKITNIGNVPLKYVTLYDPAISKLLSLADPARTDEYIFKKSSNNDLEVGAYFQDEEIVIFSEAATAAPTVKFLYNETTYSAEGTPIEFKAGEGPTVKLSCDNYTVTDKSSQQTFRYTITNTTQAVLSNVRLFNGVDGAAELVYQSDSMNPGDSYSGSYDLTVTSGGFYKCRLLYTYAGMSEEKEVVAKTANEIKLPNEVYFTMVRISPETITGPGNVTFTLRVTNQNPTTLTDSVISEQNGLFEPVSLGAISSNSYFDKEITVPIMEDNTTLIFRLSYKTDATAGSTTSSTNPLTQTIKFGQVLEPDPTPEAEITPTPAPDNGNENKKSGLLLLILILLLILVLVAAVIVALIMFRSRSDKNATEVAKRKMDNTHLFDEGYVAPDDDDDEFEDEDPSEYDAESADEYDENYDDEEPADDESVDDEGVKIYRRK